MPLGLAGTWVLRMCGEMGVVPLPRSCARWQAGGVGGGGGMGVVVLVACCLPGLVWDVVVWAQPDPT